MENKQENKDFNDRFNRFHGNFTAEEAFNHLFDEKKEYPEELKKEFIQLHDDMKQKWTEIKNEWKSFNEKWKDTIGEDFLVQRKNFHHHFHHGRDFHQENRFGGEFDRRFENYPR